MNSKPCIYRIRHKLDTDNKMIYIGSSFKFRKRRDQHKHICTNKDDRHYNTYLYQYIRENGGWDMFDCDILETCDADEEWRKQREQEYITAFKPKLNCVNAYGRNEDRKQLYLKTNHENKKAMDRAYHHRNKEKISQQKKIYDQIHKEEISKRRREVIECECGKNSTRGNYLRHRKSKHHQEYLKFNEEK